MNPSSPNRDPLLPAENEQRLRLALETGRIGLWVWNSTDVSNAGDWSPRLKEIFGLPVETVVTHAIFLRGVDEADRLRVDASVREAIAGKNGGAYHEEYRIIRQSDGEPRTVIANGQAFFDAAGEPLRFVGTVMDVTEQRSAEHLLAQAKLDLERRITERTAELEWLNAALARSEDALQVAIDTIPSLVWTSLPDGQIEYLNQRWLDYTGLRQEEANNWGWQAAIHPEDLPGLVAYWKEILLAGDAGEYEARLRRHDGEYRWFLFRAVPLRDAKGRLVKWYGTNIDIEDRRASENVARGHLGALTHLLDVLSQESDPDQLPRHVVNAIRNQLGAVSVTLWERNGERLDLLGINEDGRFREHGETAYFEGSIPVSGAAPPLWVEALASGGHILIEDIDKEPSSILLADGRSAIWHQADLTRPFAELKADLSTQGIRDLLIAPMLLADRIAGIIGIRFTGTRVFRREEIDLTKALAHQAMLAVQMMRLSRQSRDSAVVAERNRLARDIHDTLAQGFTGVIVQLEASEDARSRNLVAEADAHLHRARELAGDSLREARRSVRALRPEALTSQDLCGALVLMIEKMTAGTAVCGQFQVEGEPVRLLAIIEESLLRICQELLTNTLRHARALHFTAQLVFEVEAVRATFTDDGGGFDPVQSHDGFGLRGIQERVSALNGELTLKTAPGQGCAALIVLPLGSASKFHAST